MAGVRTGNKEDAIPLLVELSERVGKGKRKDRPDRGSVQFYQELVDYFLRRRANHDSFWRIVEEEYRYSRFEQGWDPDEVDIVQTGRVFSSVHRTENAVFNRNPKFHVKGSTPQLRVGQIAMTHALNVEWNETPRVKNEVKLGIRDCSKVGWGVALTTYDEPVDVKALDEAAEARKELDAQDPVLAAATPEIAAEVAERALLEPAPQEKATFEMDSRVTQGQVNTRRISPWAFIIDPDASCLEDARWVGRIIPASLEAVKKSPLFENTKFLKPIGSKAEEHRRESQVDGKFGASTLLSAPYDIVLLYEIFERKPEGGWLLKVVAEGHPSFLREEEDLFWVGCPYSLLRWNEDGETIFSQSDFLSQYPSIQAETRLMTKSLDAYTKQAADETFIHDEVETEESLWAQQDPSQGKKITVQNIPEGLGLRDVVMKIPKDPISPEPLNFLAVVDRNMEQASGFGPNQMSRALKSGTSAREADEISRAAASAIAHKQDAVEMFVANIAYQRLSMMLQFYDSAKVARLIGAEHVEAWESMRLTRADIENGLKVTVHQGSMRPVSDDANFQRAVTAIQTMSLHPALMANTNLPKIQEDLFEALYGIEAGDYVLEKDPEKVANAVAMMALAQGTQGSAPNPRGVPSQPGGQG